MTAVSTTKAKPSSTAPELTGEDGAHAAQQTDQAKGAHARDARAFSVGTLFPAPLDTDQQTNGECDCETLIEFQDTSAFA